VLMIVENVLNFWVEDMNWKRVTHFITIYYYYYYFNFGNVLLFVIYPLNITVFMYVTRMSRYIRLYIEFGIIRISRDRGRFWNALPVDTGFRLYIDWAWILRVLTAVLYVRRADTATLWTDQLFSFLSAQFGCLLRRLELRQDLSTPTTARCFCYVCCASVLSCCSFLREP
jgi:hypothetical protein